MRPTRRHEYAIIIGIVDDAIHELARFARFHVGRNVCGMIMAAAASSAWYDIDIARCARRFDGVECVVEGDKVLVSGTNNRWTCEEFVCLGYV